MTKQIRSTKADFRAGWQIALEQFAKDHPHEYATHDYHEGRWSGRVVWHVGKDHKTCKQCFR